LVDESFQLDFHSDDSHPVMITIMLLPERKSENVGMRRFIRLRPFVSLPLNVLLDLIDPHFRPLLVDHIWQMKATDASVASDVVVSVVMEASVSFSE
jgi:hypothetical protein